MKIEDLFGYLFPFDVINRRSNPVKITIKMKEYDLEDRLINFSVEIIQVVHEFPKTSIGRHLGAQLLRSGTAPALLYGEAQGAES